MHQASGPGFDPQLPPNVYSVMIKVCEREQFLHELSKVRSLVKDTTIKNVSSG